MWLSCRTVNRPTWLVPKQANNQSADGQFAAIEFEA